MLFDLAGAAGLEQKRAAMAAGHHINTTEDRAVMHIALRAPITKQLIVDGANVVPDVHAVLEKVPNGVCSLSLFVSSTTSCCVYALLI